jgi:glucosylceramidase
MNKPRASITGVCAAFFIVACGAENSDSSSDPATMGPPGTTVAATPPDDVGPLPATDPSVAVTPPGAPAVTPPGAPAVTPPGAPAMTPPGAPAMTPPGAPAVSPPANPGLTPDTPVVTPPDAAAATPMDPVETPPSDPVDVVPVDPVEPPPVTLVELPALVTSGSGAYWQVGELTEMPGGGAEVTVDENDTSQVWLGFGGTFNEAGWDALSVLEASEKDRALELLFDAADGANFAWGRIPMGASDYAMDRYSLSEVDNDYGMENFSIDRDQEKLIPYIQAALAIKSDVRLWASPWSPPAWMKVNGQMNGLVNGNDSGARVKDEPEVLGALALYFARFVEDYAAEGLVIEHVQPQNEPGYATRYPSCLWTPSLLAEFVGDYLGPTLAERSPSTEIWFGTMSAPEDSAHLDAVMATSTSAQYVKGFGLQWNTMNSAGSLASRHGFPVMQTEHKCGNYPWETASFNPDRPPNDHAYAVESWGLIKDWINAGVSIYSAWNMVLDTQGQNLDEERPWPQNALLAVDRGARTLNVTPAYYVFRHFSQFVHPGATRVGTNDANALAFMNTDGSVVTVLHNSGGSARDTTLSVGGTTVQFSIPGQGFATVNLQASVR